MKVTYTNDGGMAFHSDDVRSARGGDPAATTFGVHAHERIKWGGVAEPPTNIDIYNRDQRSRWLADLTVAYGKHDWPKTLAVICEAIHRDIEEGRVGGGSASGDALPWDDIEPLPSLLRPVAPFDFALLPGSLCDKVKDIAERMSCPPDFIAVAIMVALSSLIGDQLGIRPKRYDDWLVVPNLWGLNVGRPGVLKSPAVDEGIKDMRRVELDAKKKFDENQAVHEAAALVARIHVKDLEKKIAQALKDGDHDKANTLALEAQQVPEAPKRLRVITNDSTIEKLGELLRDSARCILVYRDEIIGLLRTLDREDRASDRGFYLESWNGTSLIYSYDRIGRGTIDILNPCVSILGSIQPGVLQSYVNSAIQGGQGDDGLLQRFQMAVWPDIAADWVNVDRYPEKVPKETVSKLFDRLVKLDVGALQAKTDTYGHIPFLRFGDTAQKLFDQWRVGLENRIRGDDYHPVYEAHLSKFRSLVPSIALISHVIEDDRSGTIGEASLLRALSWSEYLESHAQRIYAYANQAELLAAMELLKHILVGDLGNPFTAREVSKRHWSVLDVSSTQQAIAYLEDSGYIRRKASTQKIGRPRVEWEIHPQLLNHKKI